MTATIARNRLRRGAALALVSSVMLGSTFAADAPDRADAPAPETPEWVSEARASAGKLAGRLIPTLQTAIQQGGPIQGITVCSTEAPEIAAAVSDSNLRIGRTALRVRNPANAADEWERSVLEDFQRRIAEGADPSTLEAWQVHAIEDREVGRWMKAIPTAPMCTTCHGTEIDADLAATIREHYPDDRATGFQEGDLRGAFTATVEF